MIDVDEIVVGGKYLHKGGVIVRTVTGLMLDDDGDNRVRYIDSRDTGQEERSCKVASFCKSMQQRLNSDDEDEDEDDVEFAVNPGDSAHVQMRTRVDYLTPAKARKLLSNNDCNRRVSKAIVDSYVTEIKAGRWALNGESIKTDVEDKLLDGQHRCHAVIVANRAILTVFAENVSDLRAFHTIDTGKKRNGSDALTINGEKNPTELAAILAYILRYEKRTKDALERPKMTNSQAISVLAKHPEARRAAEISKLKGLRDHRCPAQAGLAWYVLYHAKGQAYADKFIDSLSNGYELKQFSPIMTLRSRLHSLQQQKNAGSGVRDQVMALVIQATNAYVEGREMKRISYSDNRPFPRFFNETMFKLSNIKKPKGTKVSEKVTQA